jgi:hypothetical protein
MIKEFRDFNTDFLHPQTKPPAVNVQIAGVPPLRLLPNQARKPPEVLPKKVGKTRSISVLPG